MLKKAPIALLALLAMSFPRPAGATIIAVLDSGPTPIGTNFAFNYRADLTNDERLDPNATNGVTCPGLGGAKTQCNPTGTFFTLYDIGGFQSVNVTAPNWFATLQFTGVTPSTINGGSFDDPNKVNVTFFYTGPVVNGPANISGFQIISSFGSSTNGNFTSQSTKNVGDSSGNTDQLAGPVTLPAPSAIPEPGSLVLLGTGLLGLVRRLRA